MATQIKPRKVAIAHIFRQLTDLIAENNTYAAGQVIFAVDANGKVGMKVGDWEFETEDQAAATAFVDLPWIIAPEAAGSSGLTPFKVRNGGANYAIVGADAVITDQRLIGVADPVVSSTKDGREYRDEDLNIDPVAGILKILGFGGMEDGDHISIITPSFITTSGSLDALTARVTAVEGFTAPFAGGGGGIVIWNRPAADIPLGWKEVTELRGKTVVGCNVDDVDFSPQWTKTGGSKSHQISALTMLPKHSFLTVVDQFLSVGNQHPADVGRSITATVSKIKYFLKNLGGYGATAGSEGYEFAGATDDTIQPTLSPTNSIGSDDPDAINHMNPYRIVMFIEPV